MKKAYELIEEIRSCNFECVTGSIDNSRAWQQLCEMATGVDRVRALIDALEYANSRLSGANVRNALDGTNQGKIDDNKTVDSALEVVLAAAGSTLKHYTYDTQVNAMREAMRKAMASAYIAGSNDTRKALSVEG